VRIVTTTLMWGPGASGPRRGRRREPAEGGLPGRCRTTSQHR
jgi:hypothetical protein